MYICGYKQMTRAENCKCLFRGQKNRHNIILRLCHVIEFNNFPQILYIIFPHTHTKVHEMPMLFHVPMLAHVRIDLWINEKHTKPQLFPPTLLGKDAIEVRLAVVPCKTCVFIVQLEYQYIFFILAFLVAILSLSSLAESFSEPLLRMVRLNQ